MLAVRDLAFSHDSRKLLRGANLTVADDERIALVGPNGAGKSTLLSLFAGTLKPDTGVVERGRGQRLGLLTQTPHLPLEETALRVAESGLPELFALKAEYDALADRMDTLDDAGMERLTALSEQIDARGGFDIAHRIDEVLTRLGVRARQELTGSLSGGERRRLDLARLMLAAPDIMLLDEPTNHLDAQGMTFLASLLRKHRGPLILVSHDRAFIDDVATSIVELEDGVLVPYTPPTDRVTTLYDHYLEQKLLREDIAVRSAHKKSRLFLRELAWLRAGTPARTTKQTARIERAQALATEVDEQVARVRAHQKKVELEAAKNARLGKTIITFDDVAVGRGDRTLFTGFTLAVVAGQRLGIVGENGSGKSTLLNAILTAAGMKAPGDPSAVVPTHGRVIIGKNTRIGVFDQHRASLDPEATLEEVLAGENDHVLVGDGRVHIAGYLERFLFEGSDRYRRTKTLSGGQQNRLVLARLMQQGCNCLLLDEPTNDLDVGTLGVLEDVLLDHDGVALIVSHDRRFLDRVATGIVNFEMGATPEAPRRLVHYVGNLSTALRLKDQAANASVAAAAVAAAMPSPQKPAPAPAPAQSKAAPPPPAPAPAAKPKRKRSYKEQQEFETIEATLQKKETRRGELEQLLSDGSLFRSDAALARKHTEEVAWLGMEIEKLYARWQELDELASM